jgi:hypothetical protein
MIGGSYVIDAGILLLYARPAPSFYDRPGLCRHRPDRDALAIVLQSRLPPFRTITWSRRSRPSPC